MDIISTQTRREAYESVNELVNEEKVMVAIWQHRDRFGGGLTPEEIAEVLGWDITQVRPRTTTLNAKGRLLVIGKRKNSNRRNVSVYAPSVQGVR